MQFSSYEGIYSLIWLIFIVSQLKFLSPTWHFSWELNTCHTYIWAGPGVERAVGELSMQVDVAAGPKEQKVTVKGKLKQGGYLA